MAKLRYTAPKSNKFDKVLKVIGVISVCLLLSSMSFIISYNLISKADDYSDVIRGLNEQIDDLNTEISKKNNEIDELKNEVERLKIVEEGAIEIPISGPEEWLNNQRNEFNG